MVRPALFGLVRYIDPNHVFGAALTSARAPDSDLLDPNQRPRLHSRRHTNSRSHCCVPNARTNRRAGSPLYRPSRSPPGAGNVTNAIVAMRPIRLLQRTIRDEMSPRAVTVKFCDVFASTPTDR
jgi:hypothetical protein